MWRVVGGREVLFHGGAGTRKSRNLAENPDCFISVSLPNLDLGVEGTAAIVTDDTTLQHLAELYAAQGWAPEVSHEAFIAEFSAPSAGLPRGTSTRSRRS